MSTGQPSVGSGERLAQVLTVTPRLCICSFEEKLAAFTQATPLEVLTKSWQRLEATGIIAREHEQPQDPRQTALATARPCAKVKSASPKNPTTMRRRRPLLPREGIATVPLWQVRERRDQLAQSSLLPVKRIDAS